MHAGTVSDAGSVGKRGFEGTGRWAIHMIA